MCIMRIMFVLSFRLIFKEVIFYEEINKQEGLKEESGSWNWNCWFGDWSWIVNQKIQKEK